MKNNIIALIAIPMLLAISTASSANSDNQDRDNKRNPQKMLAHLSQTLNLTETQQSQIASLIEQQQANRNNDGLSRKARHLAMKDSVAQILTDEQRSILKGMRKGRGAKRQQN